MAEPTDTNAAIVAALTSMTAGATPAAPRPAANGKILFPLSEPVTFNGEVRRDFSYRIPTGRDLRKWLNSRKGIGDDALALMVDITEEPSTFFDIITGVDFMAFYNALQPFLNGVRPTSKT